MSKRILSMGFTLIELLIVIGILGIVIVAVLLVINPAEAQKKAKDASRMKDLATLQIIMTSYLEDGNTPDPQSCLLALAGCTTTGLVGKSQACESNWLGEDVCEYSQLVPLDPSNDAARTCVTGGTPGSPTFSDDCVMIYRVKISGSSFEVNVKQESKANASNVLTDGGNSTQWSELGPNRTLLGD